MISLLIIYHTPYLNGVAEENKFSDHKDLQDRKPYSSKIKNARIRLERNAEQIGAVREVKERYFVRNSTAKIKCFFKESDKFKCVYYDLIKYFPRIMVITLINHTLQYV